MRTPIPRARRGAASLPAAPPLVVAFTLALLGGPAAGQGPSLAPLVPDVRLVGWHAVERVDRRSLPAAADRRLTPLDQGFAVHLSWALDRAGLGDGPPPGDDFDDLHPGRAAVDALDPFAEGGAADDRWAAPPDLWRDPADAAIADAASAPRRSPAAPPPVGLPPGLWVRRLAALHAARRAREVAPSPAARRRAQVDVDEARARLRLLREGDR